MFLLHGAFHNSVYQAPHNFIDFDQYIYAHSLYQQQWHQPAKQQEEEKSTIGAKQALKVSQVLRKERRHAVQSLKLPQFLTTVQNLLSMHSKLANNAKTEATLKGEKKYPCQQISTFTTFDDDPFLLDLASYQPYDFFVLIR